MDSGEASYQLLFYGCQKDIEATYCLLSSGSGGYWSTNQPTYYRIYGMTTKVHASLCGSVGLDFIYHACGHEFESRLNENFPHQL